MFNFNKINADIRNLISRGVINPNIGTAKAPVPAEIRAINKHALKHGITRDQAQTFIDNAVVMFDQGSRSLYISSEGNAVLLDKEKRLISAYGKADFDPGIKAILEVLQNGS